MSNQLNQIEKLVDELLIDDKIKNLWISPSLPNFSPISYTDNTTKKL